MHGSAALSVACGPIKHVCLSSSVLQSCCACMSAVEVMILFISTEAQQNVGFSSP